MDLRAPRPLLVLAMLPRLESLDACGVAVSCRKGMDVLSSLQQHACHSSAQTQTDLQSWGFMTIRRACLMPERHMSLAAAVWTFSAAMHAPPALACNHQTDPELSKIIKTLLYFKVPSSLREADRLAKSTPLPQALKKHT